ncbi:MAG TPA: Na/Pi symporter, partial [Syntrophomonadaceae bacterium]|nr:Na/Pi symporter [Syntrophomonadaceae bacterium]
MLNIIFGVLGGLALFLFGMKIMGEGLQKVAGDKIRKILERVTRIPVVAVLLGALATAAVQSSSATTVLVVGFVNAGLMTLKQAVGVIMGANIGTT